MEIKTDGSELERMFAAQCGKAERMMDGALQGMRRVLDEAIARPETDPTGA